MLQSKFIVWDVGQGERQLEVECGGGHRAWDCLGQHEGQGQGYRFLFIKAREAVMVTGGQRSGQAIVKVSRCEIEGGPVFEDFCNKKALVMVVIARSFFA